MDMVILGTIIDGIINQKIRMLFMVAQYIKIVKFYFTKLRRYNAE